MISASTQDAVVLAGVSKIYATSAASLTVLDQLDLAIVKGEFFSLLGPSGCGKTTALRIMAGFERPSAGAVVLDGEDVTGIPPHQRSVNMVFQSYALFPHLDVYENIEYGLRRKGVSRPERKDRVTKALSLVQLDLHRDRKITQLSGGQQQRVALARALVNRPKVLLLDEPFAALDAKLRVNMQVELKRIQRESGITFIFVTHDQHEAFAISDRIAIMNGGRIEQIGSPADLYKRPASRFVANFVGRSNFFEGIAERRQGRMALSPGLGETVWLPETAVPGENCVLLVRPEHIVIESPSQSHPPRHECYVPATVVDSLFLGSHATVFLKTAGGQDILAELQGAQLEAAIPESGTTVLLTWQAASSTVIPTTLNNYSSHRHSMKDDHYDALIADAAEGSCANKLDA